MCAQLARVTHQKAGRRCRLGGGSRRLPGLGRVVLDRPKHVQGDWVCEWGTVMWRRDIAWSSLRGTAWRDSTCVACSGRGWCGAVAAGTPALLRVTTGGMERERMLVLNSAHVFARWAVLYCLRRVTAALARCCAGVWPARHREAPCLACYSLHATHQGLEAPRSRGRGLPVHPGRGELVGESVAGAAVGLYSHITDCLFDKRAGHAENTAVRGK